LAVLRFLASLCLLVAVIAFVADLTPWLLGAKPYASTSFAKQWGDMAPATLQAAKLSVSRTIGPWAWDWGIGAIIRLPTSLLFGLTAAMFGFAGRRRRRIDVFVN
jgi:hypothetical protein